MVSSKCGRLLAAAGLPAAAVGLTLAAGGTASAVSVAEHVSHAVKITADVPSDGPSAVVAAPVHAPEYGRPAPMPVDENVRPVVAMPGHTPEQTPEHGRPGARPVVVGIVHPVISVPAHAPEHSRPETLPVVVHVVHPVVSTPMKFPQNRPEHPSALNTAAQHPAQHLTPQHGMTDPLETEKHEGFKIHVFHQTVIVKIETTAFTIAGHQSTETGS